MKKNKPKSHGKPSISKNRYNESAKAIGIDIESYGPKRPTPIMVYKIYCHYRKTLDHSKYTWARQVKYAEDSYKYRMGSDNVCNQLEKLHPGWLFISVSEFVSPDTIVKEGNQLPTNIIYNIKSGEVSIQSSLTSTNKSSPEKLKKQVLKDAGIEDGVEQPPVTKRKSKKSKKI